MKSQGIHTLKYLVLLSALPSISWASDEKVLAQDDTEVIVVEGRRNQAETEVSEPTKKLLKVAGIQSDPLSSVFTMPGIVYAGGDDGGEPAIRGSSPDDNAFYIDDMPVDYIFHLFGDSIFNENVVRDFSLYPAAFDSSYGNATGGVFDVKLRDPRNQDFTTILDVSMLKTGIMVEGGVTEDQAFYFSYRHSLIQLFLPEGTEEDGYTVFKAPVSDDYQGKYQWLIGDSHKLTFTMTGASDTGGINISAASESGRVDPDSVGDLKITTRFDQQGLSWQYYGENQKIMHVNFSHLSQEGKEIYGQGQYVNSKTEQYNLRLLYQFDIFADHKLVVGSDIEQSESVYSYDVIPYYCTDHDTDCESSKGDRIQDSDTLKNTDIAFYLKDIWKFNQDFELELGVRAEKNDYTEQSFIHPRASLNWYPTNSLVFKAKAGTYSRFPDIDTVLKKLGNPDLNSPKATHYSLTTEYELNDLWNTTLDIYYKDLGDLPLSIDGEEDINNLHYTDDLSGTAKGIEWVINREFSDSWYGWASLSWSQSDRTDEIKDVTTEYYLDTPLLANLVLNYQLNDRWDFGLRFTLRSGAKYTPITGLKDNPDYDGHYLPVYGELNSKTLPVYSRLDLEANYKTILWGQQAQWTFALLNATASKNISGYYYAPDENSTGPELTIEGEEGMELFPSIGLKIEF